MSAERGRTETAIGTHKALVDVLVAAGFADDRSIRSLMVGELRRALRHPFVISDQVTGRDQLIEIVGVCSRVDGGMAALVSVLELMRPGSPECLKARRLLFALPVHDLFPEEEQAELKEWLTVLALPELPSLVRRACRHSAEPPPRFNDAWTAFHYLSDFNTAPEELPPALIFLEFAAASAGCPATVRPQIKEWVFRQASRLQLGAALRRLRDEVATSRPHREKLHLLIVIRPDPIEPDLYQVCEWRQDEPGQWPPPCGDTVLVRAADLERHVDLLVAAAEESWAGRVVDAALEFVLPRTLVNIPVHSWSVEIDSGAPQPLNLAYPIVIRSLERMAHPRWHRRWRVRWSALLADPVLEHVYFCQDKDTEEQYRLDAILNDEHWVMMVLTEPPSSTAFPGRDQLVAALRAGLPALVWHPTASPDVLRTVVSWLVDSDRLEDLPTRARESRQAVFRNRQVPFDLDVLRDLVVLWDDPSRLVFLAASPSYSMRGTRS